MEKCFVFKFRSHILPQQLLDMGQMEVYYGFTHYCWLKIKARDDAKWFHDIPYTCKLAQQADEVYLMPENNCIKNRNIPSDELQYQRLNPVVQLALPTLQYVTPKELAQADVFKDLRNYG